MKSVLGLFGVGLLSAACSVGGDALFSDDGVPTNGGQANPAGGSSAGTAATGAGTGGADATNSGGGSSGVSGTAGTSGTGAEGGDSAGGSGPMGPDSVYVSTSGSDAQDCGLTSSAPCKTVSVGIARAETSGRGRVAVQAGQYGELVVLRSGIAVVGGFDSAWQSGPRSDPSHQVVIRGSEDATTHESVAVWAHDLNDTATLENLLIQAPNAKGTANATASGRSSYAVHAARAKLVLTDVDIIAGSGADGVQGAPGKDAVSLAASDAMNGGTGSDGGGNSFQIGCSVEPTPGGPAGTNQCDDSPSSSDMSGGKGGVGGSRDTSCTGQAWTWNYTAMPGGDGADAAKVSGDAGKGGSHGSGGGPITNQNPSACGVTGSGNPGAVDNGAAGKATSDGSLTGDFWYGLPGGSGGTGKNGGGGGGGGGSGACDYSTQNPDFDARGGGGGGGGAGGCAARSGGSGGGAGGSSFGIFAIQSSIQVSGVTITRGAGGAGGVGGVGGQGQAGGAGNAGGAHPGTATPGKGGDGGHGGHAGGGAGGAGGSAHAIALGGGSTLQGTPTIMGGAAGPGGAGGKSAPNAPDGARDGNSGEPGADGTVDDTAML